MTDIILNPGAGGATLAADDCSAISGVGVAQFQVVKLAFGAGGLRTLVHDSAGARIPVASYLQAGTSNIGTINNISATVNVVVGAGTSNIGTINNISATVNVNIASQSATLNVVVGAGISNIGTINNISATVNVVVGAGASNIGTINNISATVNVVVGAGTSNIGSINNISATVNVVVGAGTANIGSINNISATVNVNIAAQSATLNVNIAAQSATLNVNIAAQSATLTVLTRHWDSGNLIPLAGVVSTTGGTAIIAAPGVASAIHIVQIMATNKSGSLTRVKFRENSAGSVVVLHGDCASGGGGFTYKFARVWRSVVNKGVLVSCSPAVSDVAITIEHFTAT